MIQDVKFHKARRKRRNVFQRFRSDPKNETLSIEYRDARRAQQEALENAKHTAFWEFANRVERCGIPRGANLSLP